MQVLNLRSTTLMPFQINYVIYIICRLDNVAGSVRLLVNAIIAQIPRHLWYTTSMIPHYAAANPLGYFAISYESGEMDMSQDVVPTDVSHACFSSKIPSHCNLPFRKRCESNHLGRRYSRSMHTATNKPYCHDQLSQNGDLLPYP